MGRMGRRDKVFEWLPAAEQPLARSQWVLTRKQTDGGQPKYKAWLCARGAATQDPQNNKVNTASPTASRLTVKMGLSRSAAHKCHLLAFDVSAAFLQCDRTEVGGASLMAFGAEYREILLKAPTEFARPGFVMKLIPSSAG